VAEHPKEFDHVGPPDNEPPDAAGLPFIWSSHVIGSGFLGVEGREPRPSDTNNMRKSLLNNCANRSLLKIVRIPHSTTACVEPRGIGRELWLSVASPGPRDDLRRADTNWSVPRTARFGCSVPLGNFSNIRCHLPVASAYSCLDTC
jgi:hypothetical protein